ncbi:MULTISPECIES: AMP-binding protein [unclassified Pseudodesulfovibrio]|uniref:AMP-binding protein n=1 Tax=unclassified Pseudodesulfovibrio TaxID=2661612 RepID=UPI000FEB94D1|nr:MULTISPECIES: AMP-binding protein [unclassified Pseudodesulfovibrio]MCJ2166048.1 AMP-binding protein [Pseudodesulfovibrio sp. S3-i]RWU02493.1 acyl-CoA synthetase [Pseudodesulfovibrio sp. S3]
MFTKEEYASYEKLCAKYTPECPDNFNFAFDVLDALEPAKTALIHVDDAGVRREFDFGFFQKTSCRLANALVKKGVRKGDRVMLVVYRRMEYWTTMLALHRIGALPIPSPSLLTKKDISQRVNYAGISAIICEDSIVERVDEAKGECPGLKLFVQIDGKTNDGWLDYEELMATGDAAFPRTSDSPGGDDPMVIFFSSGTTGLPKMVMHNYKYAASHYTTGALWHDLEDGDVHLTVSDTGWGKSVWGKFYGQWMAGAIVFVWDFRGKFDPAALLKIVAENGITTFCAPPTIYRFLVREDLSKYDLSALRHCTTAGELLNDSVFLAWEKAFNMPIYEGYGQTETTLQVATFKFMTPKPGSIGKPVPGWDIALMDEEGNKVPQGEEGEICIRIDKPVMGLFDSYMDEPEKTASVKFDGWYHTGDKAWADEDGYLWFMGRTDDLIKSSGYRIGPFEVESALVAHDAVIEAAVTGLPDEVRGQLVKATVVLAPGYEGNEKLTKELQAFVRELTAPYKYPRVIDYVSELPKTISGKIKRKEIREADLAKLVN